MIPPHAQLRSLLLTATLCAAALLLGAAPGHAQEDPASANAPVIGAEARRALEISTVPLEHVSAPRDNPRYEQVLSPFTAIAIGTAGRFATTADNFPIRDLASRTSANIPGMRRRAPDGTLLNVGAAYESHPGLLRITDGRSLALPFDRFRLSDDLEERMTVSSLCHTGGGRMVPLVGRIERILDRLNEDAEAVDLWRRIDEQYALRELGEAPAKSRMPIDRVLVLAGGVRGNANGNPIVDEQGRLVGIVFREVSGYGIALPVEYVYTALGFSRPNTWPPLPSGWTPRPPRSRGGTTPQTTRRNMTSESGIGGQIELLDLPITFAWVRSDVPAEAVEFTASPAGVRLADAATSAGLSLALLRLSEHLSVQDVRGAAFAPVLPGALFPVLPFEAVEPSATVQAVSFPLSNAILLPIDPRTVRADSELHLVDGDGRERLATVRRAP